MIRGSTALFGIKSKLQFGKLTATALVSQQNSESKTVNTQGGAQTISLLGKVHETHEVAALVVLAVFIGYPYSALNADEVLAVAYEYTLNGQVYQVGEFSSDITTTTGNTTLPVDG